jgi:hypothetical protein
VAAGDGADSPPPPRCLAQRGPASRQSRTGEGQIAETVKGVGKPPSWYHLAFVRVFLTRLAPTCVQPSSLAWEEIPAQARTTSGPARVWFPSRARSTSCPHRDGRRRP